MLSDRTPEISYAASGNWESVPLFESRYFYIGGGKAPDEEWKGHACCRDVMERNCYTNMRQLQEYLLENVKDILKGLGKKQFVGTILQRYMRLIWIILVSRLL
ncbi:MAG: family 20 glycosylhydrolase [Lachnospiraceae bacterium]|nr:family 20 glycosylhydrolase [Lachnospiraceae bacterium]